MTKNWTTQLICGMALSFGLSTLGWADTGGQAAAFLEIPVGAGPAAMGGAYSTLSMDAYAPVWNVAGLADVPSYQVAGQHLSFLDSINYEYASVVMPLGQRQGLGVYAQYLGTGDIDETDPTGATVGQFSNSYAAYGISYGAQITPTLSAGVTGKTIQAKLADVHASAWALDGGFLYKASKQLRFAATMQNLGTKLKFISQEDPLPLAFQLGSSYQPTDHWTFALDGVFAKEADPSARAGVEWRPVPSLSLRSGIRTDALKENSALAAISLGIGIDLWGQEFSYAWVPYGILGNTQYFSLLLRWGHREGQPEMTVSEYKQTKQPRQVRKTNGNSHKNNPAYDAYRMSDSEAIFELIDSSSQSKPKKAGKQ